MQHLAQLVGAGCGAASATYPFEFFDNGVCVHTFYEAGNSLQVTVATVPVGNVFDDAVVLNFQFDAGTACTFGFIYVFHYKFRFD